MKGYLFERLLVIYYGRGSTPRISHMVPQIIFENRKIDIHIFLRRRKKNLLEIKPY